MIYANTGNKIVNQNKYTKKSKPQPTHHTLFDASDDRSVSGCRLSTGIHFIGC